MSSLLVQSYYHIVLGIDWASKSYDVQVVGIVSPNTVSTLDSSANIKKTFFTDYNLSISRYLMLVTDSTLVYACRYIKSYDPIKIDESQYVFIPESIIDTPSTYKYVEAKRYNFLAYTGAKAFNSVIAENSFCNLSLKNIRNAVNNIDEFLSDTVSVDVNSVKILTTKSELSDLETSRAKLKAAKDTAALQYKYNLEQSERSLYTKYKEAETTKSDYETAKTALLKQIGDITQQQASIASENEILNKIKSTYTTIIQQLRAKYPDDGLKTFDELYEEYKNS